jgi:hypothetical protein
LGLDTSGPLPRETLVGIAKKRHGRGVISRGQWGGMKRAS